MEEIAKEVRTATGVGVQEREIKQAEHLDPVRSKFIVSAGDLQFGITCFISCL